MATSSIDALFDPSGAHALDIEQVRAALRTGTDGLDPRDAAERLAKFGSNVLARSRKSSARRRVLANFTHLLALLLWIGGAVAWIARMPQLAVAVWLINLINGAFSSWMEFRAEKALASLRDLVPATTKVIRRGETIRIAVSEVAPGDLLVLGEGDRVPADARVVVATRLRVDESTLTGESERITKTAARSERRGFDAPNLLFAGTSIASGGGQAIAIATGMRTELGRIAGAAQAVHEEPTPIQKDLARITRFITVAVLALGILFFGAAMLANIGPAESFILTLGLVVAFVPEGLLPTFTLALAAGVRRMAASNALIKRLPSVETLGRATVICTDKTGTLTENRMTVVSVWSAGNVHELTHASPEELDVPRHATLEAAALCNDVHLTDDGQGDPTEIALARAAASVGLDPKQLREQKRRVLEIPFEPERRTMAVVVQDEVRPVVLVKGAFGAVLSKSTRMLDHDGEVALDEAAKSAIGKAHDAYAAQGLRVLAIARRTLPASWVPPIEGAEISADQIESDLTLLGLAAMHDPPRDGVIEAVAKCHSAGIRILMITGDTPLTALAIARQLGIVRDHAIAITGAELERMDDQTLASSLHDEVVFARMDPAAKLRIVGVLQKSGHVVAMTGDGVNDAPALKKADIGVAMGRAGTDAAREAADMILTDDHFASIVRAVEQGRLVDANVRKFVSYLFASNTGECVPYILFVLSSGRIPLALGVMLVLAIDLGTDLVPALALGVEPADPSVMKRPPRSRDARVITRNLVLRSIVLLGLVEGVAAMTAFYWRYWTNGFKGQWIDLPDSGELYASACTLAFGAFVAAQIGNVFSQRSETESIFDKSRRGARPNRLLWFGIALEIGALLLVSHVPFLQSVFNTAPFDPVDWLILLAIVPIPILADELWKWTRRRHATR
jgi:calcium-translocating P-type ATPase